MKFVLLKSFVATKNNQLYPQRTDDCSSSEGVLRILKTEHTAVPNLETLLNFLKSRDQLTVINNNLNKLAAIQIRVLHYKPQFHGIPTLKKKG